jgi:hypothetical protein
VCRRKSRIRSHRTHRKHQAAKASRSAAQQAFVDEWASSPRGSRLSSRSCRERPEPDRATTDSRSCRIAFQVQGNRPVTRLLIHDNQSSMPMPPSLRSIVGSAAFRLPRARTRATRIAGRTPARRCGGAGIPTGTIPRGSAVRSRPAVRCGGATRCARGRRLARWWWRAVRLVPVVVDHERDRNAGA